MDPVWLNRFGLILIPVVAAFSSERVATIGALALVGFVGLLMLLQVYDIDPALWVASLVIALGGHALTLRNNSGAVG